MLNATYQESSQVPFHVVLERRIGKECLLLRNLKVIQKIAQDKRAVSATLEFGQTRGGGGHEVTVLSVK